MKTFGAIYIGTYEISLKIFEFTTKKQIREIDHVRHRIELGRDVYSQGYIGYELVEEMCSVLCEYSKIMDGYKVDDYRAYCGTVIHDAANELFILDQVTMRTNLKVQELSNSELRFISYKSVAAKEEFNKMTQQGAAVVDVGGGSLQITLFNKGNVVTTQHLALGTTRIREKIASIGRDVVHVENQIQELVDKELEVFKALYLQERKIKYVILMGDYIAEFMKRLEKSNDDITVDAELFENYMRKMCKRGIESIAEELNLANDHDPLVQPAMVLYYRVVAELEAKSIYVPGVSQNDGIAYDYAQKHNIVKTTHDFDRDVLSAAKNMAKRYWAYDPHINALRELSAQIYDAMKKEHGLGKRERLLLETAAILHDCGKYISLVNGAQCAYDIIMSSEIFGLTHLEREIVARTVLYNTQPLSAYEEVADQLDKKSYLIVAKLAAILRVANAMDRSHKQKFKNVRVAVAGRQLVITIESTGDTVLEKGLFDSKSTFFEEVFSIKPILREKRIYA